jgi:flagellar biosynthesis/type III secretory pathway M-ring protein FliF/YscJ
MKVGQTLEVNFPKASYIVFLAGKDGVDFELKYQFVDMDASDFTKSGNSVANMSWSDFSKTTWFKYILYAALGLFVVVAVLVAVFCLYKKRFAKALYKVQNLEGNMTEKRFNAEGLEVEESHDEHKNQGPPSHPFRAAEAIKRENHVPESFPSP